MASEVTIAQHRSSLKTDGIPGRRRWRATLREASFEDQPQIAALQLRNGLVPRPKEEWFELWKGNPVYENKREHWPIGWVLEAGDRRIVGFIGNIPLSYQFHGSELRAAAACSWAVDVQYRGYSMLMLDCFGRQKDVDLFVSTTVSSGAEQAFRMFHWSRVPAGIWNKSAFWITNYVGFFSSALRMKSVPMAKMASYPISATLFCWDRFNHRAARDGNAAGIELAAGFDSRFDEFWGTWKSQNENILLPDHTRDTLTWHFRRALARRNAWIVTASRRSRLAAYAVFDRHNDADSGMQRVRLADFACLNGCDDLFAHILNWTLSKCRREGVHILQSTGLWLRPSCLNAIPAPHLRSLSSWLYYYRTADQAIGEALRNPQVWMPSSFDGDASL